MNNELIFEIKNIIGYKSDDEITIDNKENFKIVSYFGEDYIIFNSMETNMQSNFEISVNKLLTIDDENINYKYIFIFESYKTQKKLLKDITAELDKRMSQLIERNPVIYTGCKRLAIKIDNDGINYLEYNIMKDNQSKVVIGRTVNCNLNDLKKLYEIDGNNLFKMNVRQGINTNTRLKSMLENSFKSSITKMLYIRLRNKMFFSTTLSSDEVVFFDEWASNFLGYKIYDSLSNEFDNKASDILQIKIMNSFWYMHNGITIISLNNQGIVINQDEIVLDGKNVQVVNGAQTISRWFQIYEEVVRLSIEFSKKEFSNFKLFNDALNEVINNLYLKVTFVDPNVIDNDSKRFIDDVTLGLNTQVPVTEMDRFLKESDKMDDLRSVIERDGKSIARTGETIDKINTFDWKFFVQAYFTFIGKPGFARNLSKGIVNSDETVDLIINHLKLDENKLMFYNFIEVSKLIDRWWRRKPVVTEIKLKNQETKISINSKILSVKALDFRQSSYIASNGLYLFKSYLAKTDFLKIIEDAIESIETMLTSYYIKMVEDIDVILQESIVSNLYNKDNNSVTYIDNNTFKGNDGFWNQVINISSKLIDDIAENNLYSYPLDFISMMNETYFKSFDNEINRIKNSNFVFVSEFLKSRNIKLDNVRTITKGLSGVRESFPFSSKTFLNLCEIKISEGSNYPPYRESDFFNELKVSYNLFVFAEEEIKHFKIDFLKYIEEGEVIYNKVIDAFRRGDESMFPKESEHLAFHIRPKAKDSHDVVQFAETKYITKMTFWANRKTIESLIGEL